MEIPLRNTIFLQGVFYSEVKTLEDRILEENISFQAKQQDIQPQFKIDDVRVTRFRNKKQWAECYKDSTIRCWYCGLNFKGVPCFIPRRIRNTTHGSEYDTYGLFCGFSCAYTFLKTQSEFSKKQVAFDKISMLRMLFAVFHKKKIIDFKEAPFVYDMTSYGGHIDTMEYRNILRKINCSMIENAKAIDS